MVTQRSLNEWPVGLEQDAAVLELPPQEISRRSGIRFSAAEDDLDAFDGAVVELPSGELVALHHYHNSPSDGTKLILWTNSKRGVTEAVQLIQLKPSEVSWMAPGLEAEFARAFKEKRTIDPVRAGLWAAAMTATGLVVRNIIKGIRIPH